MKKWLILLCLFPLLHNPLDAQEKRAAYSAKDNASTFILKGTIDMDTGRISLIPVGEEDYYPDTADFKEAVIDHGKFTITGTVSYPLGYRLVSRTGVGYLTSMFYIEPGTQAITCHKDSLREIPKITNKSMKELTGSYHDAYISYDREYYRTDALYDSLRLVHNKNIPDSIIVKWVEKRNDLNKEYNRILVAYAKKYPDSYIVLWQLAKRLAGGYLPIDDTVYAQLSNAIKQTYTGKVLKRELDAAKRTDMGKVFPELALSDTGHALKTHILADGAHRYTLIDFWFSHCGPCLGQFPKYKKIYDTYKTKGLEIISVSVDKTTAIHDWKKVIKEKELSWPQYLDENGVIAHNLVINSYPRNFLLDEHNVIIKKDITPEQLEELMGQ